MKLCPRCEVVRHSDDFYRNAKNADGLHGYCKGCAKEHAKRWQAHNRERSRQIKKNHSDLNHRPSTDRDRARAKEWARSNPERVKARVSEWISKNPDRAADIRRRTREKYPHRGVAYAAKRRSAIMNATPPWLTQSHHAEIEGIYLYAALFGLHVDHIVPLQGKTVCGLHVPWNLQPLDASANHRKSNKLLTDQIT